MAACCVTAKMIRKTPISRCCVAYMTQKATTMKARMEPTSIPVARTNLKDGMKRLLSSRCLDPRTRCLSLSTTPEVFAHQRVYSEYDEEHILQSLSRGFADASHGLREETVLGLRPVLKSIRDIRPAPGRSFITGLLGFDDACKHFESSHQNAELDAAYTRIEVSHRHSLTFSC